VQLEWQGYYLDGRSASRREVRVRLAPNGVEIILGGGESLFWSYEEIRQTQGFYAGQQIRLEKGGEIGEALLLEDPAFLASLHRFVPGLRKQFHDPSTRKSRPLLVFFAALAGFVLLGAFYLWAIPLAARLAASHVPVSWEKELGKTVVRHLAPEKKRCSDPTRARFIEEILEGLLRPVHDSPYSFSVIVVKEPAVNALAAPGGYVVLFQGLIEMTRTAEELAGVLAHEAQHILLRHSTRALLEHASTGILVGALLGDTGGLSAFGLEMARSLGLLRYSRRSESEADARGMRMVLEAGVDPAGMIAFYETMREKGGESRLLAYISTHPGTGDRIERLKTLAQNQRPNPVKLLPNRDWNDVKRICRGD